MTVLIAALAAASVLCITLGIALELNSRPTRPGDHRQWKRWDEPPWRVK